MKVKYKIGDLVVIKGFERDHGIGLIIESDPLNKACKVKYKDQENWFYHWRLRKVTICR